MDIWKCLLYICICRGSYAFMGTNLGANLASWQFRHNEQWKWQSQSNSQSNNFSYTSTNTFAISIVHYGETANLLNLLQDWFP
jgi:hypothetical protein